MANLGKTYIGGVEMWMNSETQTKPSQSYIFGTQGVYVDSPIRLVVNVPGVILGNNQTFYVNDGINTWNWSVDANGNVSIT